MPGVYKVESDDAEDGILAHDKKVMQTACDSVGGRGGG